MTEQTLSKSIKQGIITSIPLILGFFPVAMAFGLLSKNIGISMRDTSFFSIFVFAGASQFMALDLLKAGISTGNIIIATFLLNLRHLMMSASLSVRLKEIKKQWLFFIAFGITDESFSVTSLTKTKLNTPFLLVFYGLTYLSWVSGTAAGYLVGTLLPSTLQSSLGIGLYGMFIALLVPEAKKSVPILFLAVSSGFLYIIISYFNIVSTSWRLIATIILASGAGVLFLKDETKEEEEEMI